MRNAPPWRSQYDWRQGLYRRNGGMNLAQIMFMLLTYPSWLSIMTFTEKERQMKTSLIFRNHGAVYAQNHRRD